MQVDERVEELSYPMFYPILRWPRLRLGKMTEAWRKERSLREVWLASTSFCWIRGEEQFS